MPVVMNVNSAWWRTGHPQSSRGHGPRRSRDPAKVATRFNSSLARVARRLGLLDSRLPDAASTTTGLSLLEFRGPRLIARQFQSKALALYQSMKVSGRHTCSSGRRSAAMPQRHSTDAAAIISAAPR
jgi:hypothetical protein